MARKDQKTSSNRPTVSDALTLDELDTVVGGAAAAVNPNKPNELLGPMTEAVIPVIDHTQATVAAASSQLAAGTVDAAHAIAQVGNYDTAHNIAHVTGLTDLVNTSHNPEVAAALTQSLQTGEAEKNLASLVASGQMQAGDALAALQKATDALAHMPDTTKAVTDGLFETSVAHLHAAATAAGNTNLSSYIESFHGFDLKSGRVEIAADQAAHAVVQGTLTIENAISQTISMATSQGLPKDVALTALLIDTHGHATVADQLAKYVNTGAQGAWDQTQMVKDATEALVKDTLTAGQIVETLRESVDALALYAPSKIIGTADINFAESIADLNSKVGDAHADMRSYIQTNLALDLAIGTVCNDVKYQFQAGLQNATGLLNFATNVAERAGLPPDIGYIAALAHLPQGTAEATKIANTLADHIGTSQWTAASPFVKDIQNCFYWSSIPNAQVQNFTVDKAADLIHMAVDALARYAPTRIEGTPVMHAAEVMFQLTWGGVNNIGATIKAELLDKFPYEMKLGEVLNAAQWGVTNLDVNRAIADTQNWTDKDAIPRVYGLMAAIGDHTVANANLVAQKLSDGINNGSLEQDIVNLVKAGKITAEQGVTAIEESINVLARYNKVPFGMPVDVARAYVFDKIADLATAQSVTGLTSFMKLNYLDDIKVGDQVQSYITGHGNSIGAAAEWAGFVANSHINLVISNGLATGDLSIKAIMDAEKLTGQQAEQLLFTAANTGKVAISIVVGELEALRSAANPAVAVTDMITHLGTAIKANTLNDDVAVQLIAGLASYSTAAAQGAHDTFDALIKSGDLKAQQVLNDTYNAVVSHALNDAQALKALAIMAGSGVEDLRNGATSMFGSLVQAGHVEVKAAIDALHSIPATLLTPVQCVGALFSLVSVSKLTDQLVVAADLAKMTGVDVINTLHGAVTTAHTISANAALTVLAGMASANAAMQTAVNAELVALVKANQITADAAMTALTTLAAGNTALQNIVCSEVTALVTAGVSTAAHAVDVLARFGAGATDATQRVIGEEIATLISTGKIQAITAAQQLCGLVSAGTPALRAFVGEELASLVSHNLMSAQNCISVLRGAFNNQITPAFWTTFSAMTGEANATLQSAAQGFILPFLQAGNGVASAMSSIDSAVTSGAINAHQAVVTLGCLAQSLGNDTRAIAPIVTEFGAIVHRGAINASDAMLDLIHAAGKPSVQLLVALANNEKAMLVGVGEAMATYAAEAKQTSTQIFNLLTANAPYVQNYGTRALTDSSQLLAISLGMAATAAGDLKTAAENVVGNFLSSGQSGLQSLNNYNPWSSSNFGDKLDRSQVMSILVDAGMHTDAAVRTAALNAIGTMADHGAGWGQAFNGVDLLKQINTAAGKTADGLKFVGDAAMQLLNHNANPQPILDYITGSTSSYVQRSWSMSSGWGDEVSDFGGSGYKTVRNFAEGDALNMLSQIAGGASAAMRDLIANEILTSGIAGTPAALKTFMTNHLGDGLAEAIMAKQVASGVLTAANAITTLNGLVADYMKSHATEDLNVVKNVAMAHLDLAVHAAVSAVENAASKAQTDVWNWGNNAQKMIVPAGLTALQALINTPANLQQVLTGLGMLQMSQTTAVGMADIVNMAHVAIIDFTMASAHGTQALAEKAASQASSFFQNGFDLLAANWTVAGIIKNEVIAHPENYQSWVNLGSRLAGSSMATELGSQIIGGKWEYRAINMGSGMLAAAFENDAVIHALGKDQAQTLSSACRIVSLGCSGLTNAFSGVVNIGAGNAITASTALFNTFSDINSGRNASASAQTFGNASLALFTGASATDLRNAGSNFGNMWGHIFTGGDVKGDANNFGNDMQKALYTNNQYMDMVSAQAQASANAIANAGNKLGGAITGVANTVGNGIVSVANTVGQALSSY